MFNRLGVWIPLAIVITGLSGLIYLTAQQSLRLSANDPQIQIAEDAAAALNNGATPADVTPKNSVDINKSLANFVIVYDQNGNPATSSADFHGRIPVPPTGVFQSSQSKQDRFTWEPASGVRIAAVVNKYNQGYVLSGRSLREVEQRETWIEQLTLGGWFLTMVVSLVAVLIFNSAQKSK